MKRIIKDTIQALKKKQELHIYMAERKWMRM